VFSVTVLGRARKALLSGMAGALLLLGGNRIIPATPPGQVANSATSGSSSRVVVLTEPVKIKIAYGETILPAGIKLPVVSIDQKFVQVRYMGEIQTIPIGVTRVETSANQILDGTSSIQPNPPAEAPPDASTAPEKQLQVSLQPGYDSRMQGGDIGMREIQLLLSPHCTEAVDLTGAGTRIYNGVTYLMDFEQATAALGLAHSIGSRVPVATPGFPKNSLYYVGYDAAFEGQFNRAYLVTDVANRVVAIELVDEHPKGLWKSAASLAAASWNTYNFINARMRASDTIRVQAGSKHQDKVVVIETQMYRRVRSRVGGKNIDRYEEQENTKLFIPIPFARIILHCAQIGLSKS
jgi:hypothetical protein